METSSWITLHSPLGLTIVMTKRVYCNLILSKCHHLSHWNELFRQITTTYLTEADSVLIMYQYKPHQGNSYHLKAALIQLYPIPLKQ